MIQGVVRIIAVLLSNAWAIVLYHVIMYCSWYLITHHSATLALQGQLYYYELLLPSCGDQLLE